jgi:DNA-binding Lrp family transcriptional regulator
MIAATKVKFTKNEQLVLKNLIEQSKIGDFSIAKKLGLSQQAIHKIRHKLEDLGVIKGYVPIIDYKKIGIGLLVVLGIRLKDVVWKTFSEDQISQKIINIPQIINAYRITDSRMTHMITLGFRNTNEKDEYIKKLQSKYCKEVEILQVHQFSVDEIIKSNHLGLLQLILNPSLKLSNQFFLEK